MFKAPPPKRGSATEECMGVAARCLAPLWLLCDEGGSVGCAAKLLRERELARAQRNRAAALATLAARRNEALADRCEATARAVRFQLAHLLGRGEEEQAVAKETVTCLGKASPFLSSSPSSIPPRPPQTTQMPKPTPSPSSRQSIARAHSISIAASEAGKTIFVDNAEWRDFY